jgi:sterol desaturase/sphingolipid hydroxylase (fatty acid hydroxylase superfamily)
MNLKYIQLIVLAGIFGLQFLFEHVFAQRKEMNDWKNEKFNLAIGILNIVLTLAPAFFMVRWINFIEFKNLGLLNVILASLPIQIIIAVLLLDLWMYIWHKLNHKVGFLWRFHSFHHKDEKMNSTTALRFHIAELLFSYPGKALVCFIVGINLIPLIIYESLFSASVIIHHSNISITDKIDKFYRLLFVSPIMHRIHHSRKEKERENNYGALFSFWDRIFKSWESNAATKLEFGIEKQKQGDLLYDIRE